MTGATVRRWLVAAVVATTALAGVQCGGGSSGGKQSTNPSSTQAENAGGGAATDQSSGGGGGYVALVLSNVDKVTAQSTQEELDAQGFTGSTLDGSDADGYDLYFPGLDQKGAQQLVAEIKAAGGNAFVWEADKLP